MRFAFIAKHRHIWPVSWLCEVLEVSRSGFHAWLGGQRAPGRSTTPSSSRRSTRASRPAIAPMALAASGATCSRTGSPAGCTGSNG